MSTAKLLEEQHKTREKKRKYLDARLFIRHHTNLSKIRKKFPGGKSIRGNPQIDPIDKVISFVELSSFDLAIVLSYAFTFDRAVSLLESLNNTSKEFLNSGARPVLKYLCHRDIDEQTMMELVDTIRPLGILPAA